MVVILSIQQLAQEYKVVQENLDEVTARFMSAEELIGEKESDIKAMEAKIEELEERASTIPVLQQQVTYCVTVSCSGNCSKLYRVKFGR